MDYSDKVVLVTGASSGIGKTTAVLFATHGAKLAIVGRNADNLRITADECSKQHDQKALVIIADLATDEGCEKTAKETLEAFGRLDVLVNNVGISAVNTLESAEMETFDRIFNINVRGVFNLTRMLTPALIQAKGNIINVSSTSGSKVSPMGLIYAMTKAALNQFTRQIAYELAPKGVRVNTVSPGYTDTRIHQRKTGCSDEEYEAWQASIVPKIPLGHFCRSEDIAKMIVFLASGDCELVTGIEVKVDGGYGI